MHLRTAIALLLSLAASCGSPAPDPAPPTPAPRAFLSDVGGTTWPRPAGYVEASEFGVIATPDGDTPIDTRAQLQAAIDATPAGGTLTIAPGVYYVSRYSTTDYNLHVTAGITIRGVEGVVLRQLAGMAPSVRLIRIDAAGVTLQRLVLDGNRAAQSPDEHRAGVFVAGSGATLEDVTGREFTGDAFYGYIGSSGLRLLRVSAIGNGRNGVTLGAAIDGVEISGGTFARNSVQQIDAEPGIPATVNGVVITGAVIDAGTSTQHVIAISGSSSSTRSHGWRVVGNVINGPINVVWAEDVTIADNAITAAGLRPCVTLYRTTWNATITGNTCAMTDAIGMKPSASGTMIPAYPTAIYVVGTGTGSAPDGVVIADNVITAAAPSGLGVRMDGILSAVVVGNEIHGSGLAFLYASGITIRSTNPNEAIRSVVAVGNTIAGFGRTGIDVKGYSPTVPATISILRLVGNTIGDAGTIQSIGVSLDDGSHPVIPDLSIVAHVYGAGVTSGRL